MMKFPPRLTLAQRPTPLQPLDRLSSELGGPRIWVKRDDLTGAVTTGNKVRKLEFILARALDEGCDTLITCGGIQSNHCRATAILGAQLGMKVHLILRGERGESVPEGNLFLDYLAGAEVSCYPLREYRQLDQLFAHWQRHYQSQGRKPCSIPVGGSDHTGVWGYIACAEELVNDFQVAGISPAAIVHATGSGGTQAGLTAAMQLSGLPRVIGMAVCDDEAYFTAKFREDLAAWREFYLDIPQVAAFSPDKITCEVNDSYIGPGYAIATDEVFATIRQAASLEGIVLDPVYSGKAFHGMLEEIRKGNFAAASDIVFVHTGGVFGLMAQRDRAGIR